MLSQETIDDLHEFAKKLLAEQEKDSVQNSIVNKRETTMLTSDLDSSDDQPVTSPYTPPSSFVASAK